MRALVTGISGFVGGHLTEHLVEQGDIVVSLSASGRWPKELAHLGKQARIEQFDLVGEGEERLADFVKRKQPEVIYHLAAQSNPQHSFDDPRATWSLNLWGSFNLLEAVKPRKNAKAVRVECADKWYEYFSIQDLLSPRVLFAMDMNRQPLADRHGAPLRLIDPARYGYKSAKLITSIEFVEVGKGSMACDIGPYYSSTGEIQAGYDTPLDLGGKTKRKIQGGEITDY